MKREGDEEIGRGKYDLFSRIEDKERHEDNARYIII